MNKVMLLFFKKKIIKDSFESFGDESNSDWINDVSVIIGCE